MMSFRRPKRWQQPLADSDYSLSSTGVFEPALAPLRWFARGEQMLLSCRYISVRHYLLPLQELLEKHHVFRRNGRETDRRDMYNEFVGSLKVVVSPTPIVGPQ